MPYQTFGNTGDYQLLSLGGFSYISITKFHFALATSHGVECVGPICVLEQVGVVETPPSAWKAEVLAVIRYLHNNQVD